MSTSLQYPTLYSTIHIKILLFPSEHVNINMISHTLQYHSYQSIIISHWTFSHQYDIPHFIIPFISKIYYFPLNISTTIQYPTFYSTIHMKILLFPTEHFNINTISDTLQQYWYQSIIISHLSFQHQYDILHCKVKFIIKLLLLSTEHFKNNTIFHTLQ
jgi:ribonuclease BN (tRNA processing enzyme)